MMYGCAWKKERTMDLVYKAVQAGFRGIDTACQPKHYYEPGVGEALTSLYKDGVVERQDIFLQTKFTSLSGQDPNNIPYDKTAEIPDQVKQSLSVSLKNLKTDYIDSLVLHGPFRKFEDTMKVWRTFEEFVKAGQVRTIGISNCYEYDTLKALFDNADVKPSTLQNRFYGDTGYDVDVRKFCYEKGIKYQSFWTLTANPHILKSKQMVEICQRMHISPAQCFYVFVMQCGIVPLTGTCNEEHMKEDLSVLDLDLTSEDYQKIHDLLY